MNIPQGVYDVASSDVGTAANPSGVVSGGVPRFSMIVVSCALAIVGTSSAAPNQVWEGTQLQELNATTSGLAWRPNAEVEGGIEATRQAIAELRRISGLTWKQIGELFGVSRRSVHFWASGKPLNAHNEQRLMQILDVLRSADRGCARATRAALFEVRGGKTAFALLTEGRFEDAYTILGAGPGRLKPVLTELSAAEKVAREPLPPEELVEARSDRVHREIGRSRAARTIRDKRRGTT